MPLQIEHQPPEIEFDEFEGDELMPLPEAPSLGFLSTDPVKYRSALGDPWLDYARILTPDGGVLILIIACPPSGRRAATRLRSFALQS